MNARAGTAGSDIVDRLVDGRPIDWDATREGDPPFLDGLHTLDQIRTAYRRIDATPGPDTPALFHWGPLAALEKAGVGSSAEVYRAWDTGLSTMVALKLLRPEAAAAGVRSTEFLHEGRLLAQLSQRNVLRVYGAAVHDGRPGIWSEWIDGRALDALVAENGPLADAEARHVGLELCAALAAIHAAGLVHGDVKASNVLRARGGRIVLADLGAANDADSLNASLRTQATPTYLSPQAREGAPRSAADDLYALGVLLHFLLTGRYPEAGRSRVLEQAPTTDAGLAAVIERALGVDPALRFESARAFADALRHTDVGIPTIAQRRFARTGFFAAATVVIALAGAVVWHSMTSPSTWAPRASLIRLDRGEKPLHDGDTLQVGDRLGLELATEQPAWTYVLNEDASGSFHVLFPLGSIEQTNPLPRGSTVLPGTLKGRTLSWQVSSQGGREEFVIVVADAPLPALERRLDTFTAVALEAPERGIARIGATPLTNVALQGQHLNALLDEFAAELAERRHVRVLAYHFDAASR